jgi:hypothetical protein
LGPVKINLINYFIGLSFLSFVFFLIFLILWFGDVCADTSLVTWTFSRGIVIAYFHFLIRAVLFFTDCGGDDFFAACIILVGCLEMCLRLLSRWHQINVGIIYCAPLSLSLPRCFHL